MTATKNKFSFLQHAVTALTLILKGYEKLSHHYVFIGSTIMLAGVLIIAFAIYEKRKHVGNEQLSILVHFCEAFVMLLVTYIFIIEGKKYIQYVTLLTSIGFFIATFVHYRKMKRKEI